MPEIDKIVAISNFFNVSTDSLLIDSVQLNPLESMDRMVIKFLNSAQEMENVSKILVDITGDGVIDNGERAQVKKIMETLDSVNKIIEDIKNEIKQYE